MTKDEALRLALEAMEEIIHWYAVRDRNDVFLNFVDQNPEIQKIMKSISVVKEALETKDEPVAWEQFHEHMAGPNYVAPQSTWVGLTDDEMRELEKQFEAERVRTSDEEYLVIYPAAYWQWQRAIEAKLKEKNT